MELKQLFLEVSEKIKWCRRQYHIKQEAFQAYGISRSYISMAENGRRIIPNETVELIYSILLELSDGALQEEFTLELFKKSAVEQAKDWVSERCRLETLSTEYEKFKKVVAQYELYEEGLKLEELIAVDYQQKSQWIESNQHFSLAISYASLSHQNPTLLYRGIGLNMEKMGMYEESISYLKMSLHSLSPDMTEYRYKILYNLAKGYFQVDQLDLALNHIDLALREGETPQPLTRAAHIILKGIVLRKCGRIQEAIDVQVAFIENPCYPPFVTEVYQNLSYLYKSQGRFEEALEVLNHLVQVVTDEVKKHLALGLMGTIYYELGDYELAEDYLNQSKEKILKYGIFEQAKAVTSSLIDMYILKGVESQMINFFDEINEYVGQKYLSPAIFHHVKSYLFDQFYHNKIDERQFKLWMFHVECLGRD